MEGLIAEALKVISIILLTMLKFIFGPTLGYAAGYSYAGTVLITVTGMMLSVVLFTYLGEVLQKKILARVFRNRKVFTKRNRKFVSIWKKYGVRGVAFLTPLILTPIGGTLLLTSYKTDRTKIIKLMTLSAIFWSLIFSGLIYIFGNTFLKLIP